jgi:hypothetical protein
MPLVSRNDPNVVGRGEPPATKFDRQNPLHQASDVLAAEVQAIRLAVIAGPAGSPSSGLFIARYATS